MSKPRVYTWTDETPEGSTVRVTAEVTGYEHPGRGFDPPEYREVEITVERSFCPSTPDRCAGCEWEDITEVGEPDWPAGGMGQSQQEEWDQWLDDLRWLACEKDDDAAQAAFERAHEPDYEDMGR